jgi:hypothetical protein
MADGRKVAIAAPPLPSEHLAMKSSCLTLAAALLTTVLGSIAPAHPSQDNPKPTQAPNLTGLTISIFGSVTGRPIIAA